MKDKGQAEAATQSLTIVTLLRGAGLVDATRRADRRKAYVLLAVRIIARVGERLHASTGKDFPELRE